MTDRVPPLIRRDCRWHGRISGWDYCKLPAVRNPTASPVRLDRGCPPDCIDYTPVPWKRNPDDWENEA